MTAAIASIFNPFPGLRSFEPSEAHLFFGRDAHVDELVRKLGRSHFVAVVGTSGSGKSSLVRAGLIPSLESGYLANAGSGWKIALLRPGLDPIQSFARSLARFDNPAEAGYDLETRQVLVETTLRRSSLGLLAAAREIGISSSNNLLVIVDQFEEIFRFRRNRESDAELHENTCAFVKMLLEAAGAPDRDIFVVLTMRSDFLGDCPQFPGLPEAINDGQYLIPRMSRDERRTAIEGPIAVGESEITARLVQRLQNDVGENPDQLPVLQQALMRAWDRWHESKGPDELIDVDDYERIGTMAHALSLHSDEALQSLSPTQQVVARQTFQALCEKDIEGREMRRPAKLSEICAITEQREQEVLAVIDAFRSQGRTFLLPPYPEPIRSTSIIDISHESLIRLWDRLRGWVEAEAQSAATYGRLADAALRFNAGAGSLWRDPELRLALDWKERFRPNQAWADRYHPAFAAAIEFLDRSRSAREAQARRRRMMLAGLVVATAFCALLAAAALLMWRNSESEKHKAIAAEKRAISSERNARTAKEEADHRRLDAQFERDRARLAEQRAKESAAREKAVATERQRALEENRTLQRSVLSRYLGREAAALMPYPHTLQTAALLAVESLKHDPSLEGRSALLEILMVLPEVVYPKPIGAADAYRLVATNQMPANDGTILASRFTRDNKRVLVVRRISPEGLIAELVDFASGDITRTLDLKERVVHWAIDNAGSKLALTDPSGLVRLFEICSTVPSHLVRTAERLRRLLATTLCVCSILIQVRNSSGSITMA